MLDVEQKNAFDILQEIESRSSGVTGGQEASGRFWSGIGFRLDNVRYVAPLTEVAEILAVPTYTKVPGARAWVRGIANIRGTLLPLMDLSGFLGKKSSGNMRTRRVLVIHHNSINSGVMVDEVLGLQHFEESEMLEKVSADEAILPFIEGAFSREGEEEWKVFSLFSLAEHASFMQVAL